MTTTMTKYTFEQNRIDDIQWSGVSEHLSVPSLLNNGESLTQKTPLFYLKSISINNHDKDIYFVNNSEQTLRFVAPFELYQSINNIATKTAEITKTVERGHSAVHNAKLYADDMPRLYTEVLPHQGVRIGCSHLMADSALMQWVIQVPYKSIDSHYAIWRFNVLEKDGIGDSYPLLWDDFSKPEQLVSCEYSSKHGEMPIEPSIYELRCWLLEQLIEQFGESEAIFIVAINDVLYRYCIGWSAPYIESDIQAKDIAHKLQQLKPIDAKAVKTIVQAVYDFWFDKGFAKNISEQACLEMFDLYHAWIANSLYKNLHNY